MTVSKLFIEPSVLGTMILQQHVRTLTKQVGRNKVPEFELFEVATEKKGKVEIQVPVEKAIKGLQYGTPLEIVEPCVIPRSTVNKYNDAKRAKVTYILTCDQLKIKGGM